MTFESTFWSWKQEKFGFYINEVFTSDRSFTQFRAFSFTFWFCTWKFWKATFESLGAQRWNPLYKKMETCFYICVIVLNCVINLVSRQFVHNFKICQYVNLSSLNQYCEFICVQPSVNRSAKLSLKNMSKRNDWIV